MTHHTKFGIWQGFPAAGSTFKWHILIWVSVILLLENNWEKNDLSHAFNKTHVSILLVVIIQATIVIVHSTSTKILSSWWVNTKSAINMSLNSHRIMKVEVYINIPRSSLVQFASFGLLPPTDQPQSVEREQTGMQAN